MAWSPSSAAVYSAIGALALVSLLVVPTNVASGWQTILPGEIGISAGASLVRASLQLGGPVGVHYNPFYAVVMGDGGLTPWNLAALGTFLNSTPISFIRLGDGGPSYDPTTSTVYNPPARGGTYVASPSNAVNYQWFQAWCQSRTPSCTWIADLPAEQNNTTLAVHVAKWYHKVLGFAPTMWELGNEPNAWTHYGINVTKWSTRDNSVPTALDYATMAKNYINAVRTYFPSDQFVGIESSSAYQHTFLTQLATTDGSKIATIAYHNYPSATNSTTNITQYYGALQGPTNIPNTTALVEMAVAAGCATCAQHLPIELGEYQGGPASGSGLSPLDLAYQGAPFMAASVIQALDSNISTFTAFDINRLYVEGNQTINPEGYLYQRILDNMTMGTDYAVNVTAGHLGGIYAIEVHNGTRKALLIVNTNMTYSLSLTISTAVFPVGATGSTWSWSPSLVLPYPHLSYKLPSVYTIPRQGILLITNY